MIIVLKKVKPSFHENLWKYVQLNMAKDFKPKSYPGYNKIGPAFKSVTEARNYVEGKF